MKTLHFLHPNGQSVAGILRILAVAAALVTMLMLPEGAARAANGVPRPDHLVIVMFENHAYKQIIGASSAPYINSLASSGANMTFSHGVRHPSEPNYVALWSGSTQGISTDSCPASGAPFHVPNLGSELIAAGLSVKVYSEELPSQGYVGCRSGSYVYKHNPAAIFAGNMPAGTNVAFSTFPTDFTQLPTVSFVVPNLCNDMHSCSVATGDKWMKAHMDDYHQWAKTHNSLLIISFDEDNATSSNVIPTIFAGQMVKVGTYSQNINHYSVLRTIEDMYNLSYAGASSSAASITGIWQSNLASTPGPAQTATKASAATNTSTSQAGPTSTLEPTRTATKASAATNTSTSQANLTSTPGPTRTATKASAATNTNTSQAGPTSTLEPTRTATKASTTTNLLASGSNLVLNASFETAGVGGAADAANWTEGSNHTRASDKAHSGTWSLKSTYTGTGTNTRTTLAIAVNAGTVYTYSGYIWRSSTTGGSCLDMNDIPGETQLCTTTTGSWKFLSGTWNSGTNTSVTLRLITDGTPNGNVWFDDISLVPQSGPSPTSTPAQAAQVIVAGAGDIACGAGSSGAACKQMETSNLLVSMNPDKVLDFGDNQYENGTLSDFQNFYGPSWGRLKSKTSPAVGNHEYLTSGASGYYSYFGAAAGDPSKGYYSYNLGGWHFIALNSNCPQVGGGCGAGSPQYVWLQNDLNASSALCTIAYFHHPLWSSSSYATQSVQPFVQLLYNKGVELLLVGHAHNYERFARQNATGGADPSYGIREIVVGTGGRNFTSFGTIVPNSEVRNASTFGVIKLTLRPGDYTWQFVPISGSSFTDGPVNESCHAAHP